MTAHPDATHLGSTIWNFADVPPVEVTIESSRRVAFQRIQTGQNPLVFKVLNDAEWIYFPGSSLNLEIVAKDGDGNNLAAANVTPANYFPSTMIATFMHQMGTTDVTPSNSLYAHKAYVELIDNTVLDSVMTVWGFTMDTPGHVNETTTWL